MEYSAIRKPSEALSSYLDSVQAPQTKEAIAQALVDGGYGWDTQQPYWILIRAIDYFIGKKTLVERNGLIGKADWPKALFDTEKERPHPKA